MLASESPGCLQPQLVPEDHGTLPRWLDAGLTISLFSAKAGSRGLRTHITSCRQRNPSARQVSLIKLKDQDAISRAPRATEYRLAMLNPIEHSANALLVKAERLRVQRLLSQRVSVAVTKTLTDLANRAYPSACESFGDRSRSG